MIEGFAFPVLSAIVFLPIVAAVIILFMDERQRDLIRGVAISTAVVLLALSAGVYVGYNSQVSGDEGLLAAQEQLAGAGGELMATQMFHDGLAFVERVPWVESLGISYFVGCGRPQRADGAADGHGRGGRCADLLEYPGSPA
jgi:NADH:ubiquinone oxidoreductase subunit 4 (subunit M)